MNISEIFGNMVFNDEAMKTALPRDTYKALKNTIKNGVSLSPEVAKVVANAMKTWAIEKGATHYTHWFQPMTGITAEKHDSFVTPSGDGVIMSFSGDSLIRSEPDASSFPSGGLRETFEARGYTAWDPTSYAFIKDGVLCIPSAFHSYSGEALDKKTPLLRSMELINRQALRILKLFGDTDVKAVNTTVGVEQEFFLIDSCTYKKRPDLMFCGRTLFGAKPPRGQELDDHYYGTLKPRVSKFLKELSQELWSLGIYAKTHHNEVAPSQHELACVFTNGNISADQNQLVMEILKSLAKKHDMECLLHEKPFEGVNGSGKHNNWSMSTDTGKNLLDPGSKPYENKKFLVFMLSVVKALDEYGEILRASVASAGNDNRLGSNEAPPAIISVYLGSEIEGILSSFEQKIPYVSIKKEDLGLGINSMAHLPKDTTDRNRTSPFAFTGNKFEFRMPGSSTSISEPNFILNTIVAESLMQFADYLEKEEDFEVAVTNLISETVKKHKRIIFNGNNYSSDWLIEAEKRGLKNLSTTVDALPALVTEKSINLFEKHKILQKNELLPRCEIMLEDYVKHINIEARTMIGMVEREIIPSIFKYEKDLVTLAINKKSLGLNIVLEEDILKEISNNTEKLKVSLTNLKSNIDNIHKETILLSAQNCRDFVVKEMENLRTIVDNLEGIVYNWPFPSYAKILYSV
ncbi:MAG: glutamine synthetase III [Defluviitaleaceae bacterium]|nr:glutamine synthetase III [Defluviitaleaceae bacterium]